MDKKTPEQQIEDIKKESEYYRLKFIEFKKKFVELEQSTLRYKLTKAIDKVMSFLVVMMSTNEKVSFPKRLIMFSKTICKWALNGFKLEDEQTSMARLAICKSCPELHKPSFQCGICGCMMKTKTKLTGASCPLKKW
jgi:hypothetical protein